MYMRISTHGHTVEVFRLRAFPKGWAERGNAKSLWQKWSYRGRVVIRVYIIDWRKTLVLEY
eukprot:6046740-Pyramimonas_sp.AAC.1